MLKLSKIAFAALFMALFAFTNHAMAQRNPPPSLIMPCTFVGCYAQPLNHPNVTIPGSCITCEYMDSAVPPITYRGISCGITLPLGERMRRARERALNDCTGVPRTLPALPLPLPPLTPPPTPAPVPPYKASADATELSEPTTTRGCERLPKLLAQYDVQQASENRVALSQEINQLATECRPARDQQSVTNPRAVNQK